MMQGTNIVPFEKYSYHQNAPIKLQTGQNSSNDDSTMFSGRTMAQLAKNWKHQNNTLMN